MAAFLEADEVGDYVPDFDADADATVVQKLCDVASALVRNDFPGIDQRIGTGKLDEDIVKWVVATMVGRAVAAPDDGSTRDSERIGEWSGSKSYRQGKGLFLTNKERARLAGGTGGAFTVTLNSSIPDA